MFCEFLDNATSSTSELDANLHLIKLYVWYILRNHPMMRRFGALAKLERGCLDKAFEEMRSEGFAEDGLFSRMQEFFLPLTISKQELDSHWSSNGDVQRAWTARRDQLIQALHQLKITRSSATKNLQRCDTEIEAVKQKIEREKAQQSSIRERLKPMETTKKWAGVVNRILSKSNRSKKISKEESQALHVSYQESEKHKSKLLRELEQSKEKQYDIQETTCDMENQIEETQARLSMIETKLNTPQAPVDDQLVKPPRGLVLYGPPGESE